jgi:hypothetical protein
VKARHYGATVRRRTRKRVGSRLVFAVLAVMLAGMIAAGWLAIAATRHALRWLKGRRRRPVPQRARDRVAARDVHPADPTLERLDRLVAQARLQLPDDLVVHLYSVRCSIAQALPWLVQGPAHEADLFTVRETVRRYLPDTLAHYLALPPAMRTTHAVKDGKSARQLLAEQLALLDEEMRGIAAKVSSTDVQALLANGRFLEARFGRPDLVSG